LTFANPDDYDKVEQGDELEMNGLIEALDTGKAMLKNLTNGAEIELVCQFSQRQKDMLLAGGLLKYTAR
jgi:aconitate hydratase